MIETHAWSVLLRTTQIAIESSSTLMVGFLIAAIMRRMLGAAGTRKLFGGTGLKGLFRAWVIGSLLPVCSLGVIPVAYELRRAGVASSTVFAFILAAPQLNPLSFLYGLTLSEPIVIISFVFATMLLAILGGELWKRLFETPNDTLHLEDEPMPAPGGKRLLAVLVSAGRDMFSKNMLCVLIGILFTGRLAGHLPHGSLSMTMRHDDLFSPALMMLIGLPAYSGVLQGMMRIGLIFEHGNSVGAAFVLFESGVGLNLGLIVWLIVNYPIRKAIAWLALMIAIVLATGYAMEPVLYFAEEEASHTHAFDEWTSPFQGITPDWRLVRDKALQKIEVLEPIAMIGLACFLLTGGVLLLLERRRSLEPWLTTAPPPGDQAKSIWNRGVPGPVLGVVALLGLVAFSVVSLFIYYPDKQQAFSEIVQVRTEAIVAVRTGKKEEAIRRIQQWDLLTRKLQVGVFLRTGTMPAEANQATQNLREQLEELRDALLENRLDDAKAILTSVEAAYQQCKLAYRLVEK